MAVTLHSKVRGWVCTVRGVSPAAVGGVGGAGGWSGHSQARSGTHSRGTAGQVGGTPTDPLIDERRNGLQGGDGEELGGGAVVGQAALSGGHMTSSSATSRLSPVLCSWM